ncbi:hypothetical protein F0U44_15435 [Nocardioides humilatus]|uniref:Uncharacterized protein n=1 Tax=Nocardioides humilatus TaxID=2607660 RepID=A0A5B1LDK1_9ACTN|nr:hypothetical protein [Nocardioides humilatus]KAA1417687.1 hypothetical protein F0U44_15435 [Nocardioides humilatus]
MKRHDLPGLVNGPVLFLAGLLASPSLVLLSQGLLTVTELLTRYLLITVGCVALWGVVRAGLSGMVPAPLPALAGTDDSEAITGVVLDPAPGSVPVGPTTAQAIEREMPAEELIELSLRKAQQGGE